MIKENVIWCLVIRPNLPKLLAWLRKIIEAKNYHMTTRSRREVALADIKMRKNYEEFFIILSNYSKKSDKDMVFAMSLEQRSDIYEPYLVTNMPSNFAPRACENIRRYISEHQNPVNELINSIDIDVYGLSDEYKRALLKMNEVFLADLEIIEAMDFDPTPTMREPISHVNSHNALPAINSDPSQSEIKVSEFKKAVEKETGEQLVKKYNDAELQMRYAESDVSAKLEAKIEKIQSDKENFELANKAKIKKESYIKYSALLLKEIKIRKEQN